MRYKASKYNIEYQKNGKYIFCNLLTKNIISTESSQRVKEISDLLQLNSENYVDQQEICTKLKSKGFLVPENFDEFKYFQDEIFSILYSRDTLNVTIIPTDACNFDCVYCYQRPPYHVMSDEVAKKYLLFFERNLRNYRSLRIDWFGGEPLLEKKRIVSMMQEIRKLCQQNKVAYFSQITTNGYELDVSTFEKLLDCHVMSYQITLDGPEQIHNARRFLKGGGKTFLPILNNLREIRDTYPNRRFLIIIRVNLDHEVIPQVESFFDLFLQEFGADKRFLLSLEPTQDWGGEKIEQHKEELLQMEEMKRFTNIQQLADQKGISMFDNDFSSLTSSVCFASQKHGFVFNYDGEVYKCPQALYDEDESIRDSNHIGTITDGGQMWLDSKKESMWIGPNLGIIEQCQECKIYPICGGLECPYGIRLKSVPYCRNLSWMLESISTKVLNKCNKGEGEIV